MSQRLDDPAPESAARSRRKALWIIIVAVVAVAGLATATIMLWPRSDSPPPEAPTGQVDPPAGDVLAVAEYGWSLLEQPEAALSLALTVTNESALVAKETELAVIPVDDQGNPVAPPITLTLHTALADATAATTAVVPMTELDATADPTEITDLAITIGDTTQWWHDAGDIAATEDLTLSGHIEFIDTHDGLSNLEFTLTRQADRTWLDFQAIALFRDQTGRLIGGCQSEYNIVGNEAPTRIIDCAVPPTADREQTETHADTITQR